MPPKPIEIFRPGRHTAMNGATIEFSAADLAASARAYNPAVHEAPIVIGHPSQDAPAYGWVKTLSFADDSMQAGADELDPAFAEAVGTGRFKKVSASFYTPGSAANPVPGVYYLRHVGFLGAQPPAVKGLRQVQFGEADESVTVEFGDYTARTTGTLLRSLRDWFIGKFGQEEADKAMPPWSVDAVQESAAQVAPDVAPSEGFSESSSDGREVTEGTMPEVAPADSPAAAQPPVSTTPAEKPPAAPPVVAAQPSAAPDNGLDAREEAVKKREAEIAKREQAHKLTEHNSFLEGLVRSGQPLPCSQELIISFMRLLDGEASVSFGESEQRSPLELFKSELLAKLPRSVEFRELSRYAAVDNDPEAIAARAVAYQEGQRANGNIITTTQAVEHVTGAK